MSSKLKLSKNTVRMFYISITKASPQTWAVWIGNPLGKTFFINPMTSSMQKKVIEKMNLAIIKENSTINISPFIGTLLGLEGTLNSSNFKSITDEIIEFSNVAFQITKNCKKRFKVIVIKHFKPKDNVLAKPFMDSIL